MSSVDIWERRTEWPLTATALVFLAAYAIPIVRPGEPAGVARGCEIVVVTTWAMFGLDYAARLALSDDRWLFVRRNLLDLAVLALPVMRPLRLLRLVTLLSVVNRNSSRQLRGRVVSYVISGAGLLVLCGALAITDAEHGAPNANIRDIGDGLWWAISTMSTVGYGDRYPVTAIGRCVAAALMLAGIAFLGVVTATLASWLVERVAEANEPERAATQAQVEALTQEIRSLRESLGGGGAAAAAGPVEIGSPQGDVSNPERGAASRRST